MKTLTVDEAQKDLTAVVREVCDSNSAVLLRLPDGREIQLVPLPKASKTWRGRPLYTKDDLAKMKCPYPDEPEWE